MSSLSNRILKEGQFQGIFAGWGESRVVAVEHLPPNEIAVIGDTDGSLNQQIVKYNIPRSEEGKLSLLYTVSIAGCDLMSSCLYTASVCAYNSGKVWIGFYWN